MKGMMERVGGEEVISLGRERAATSWTGGTLVPYPYRQDVGLGLFPRHVPKDKITYVKDIDVHGIKHKDFPPTKTR